MTRSTAAVFHAAGDLRVSDRDVPKPGLGEVLVRVWVCGVCGSDATEYARGPVLASPPVVLGHEFAGTVEALGPGVTDLPIGASVVCGAGIACGECRMCRRGRTNLCDSYHTIGLHRDGGLARYALAPASTLHDVTASGLSLDTLGLAQPMAVAVHTVRRSGLGSGMDAVVLGIGGIGSFITVAAAATGARVLAVDRDPDRLGLAHRLGASATLVAGSSTLAERLVELDMAPDVLFEVSGSAAGLASVLDAARPGSVIVPVGIQKEPVALDLGSLTLREYTLVGTVAHVLADDIPEAVRLLGSRPDWSDVAAEVIPLRAVVAEGLEPLVSGGAAQIKTLIDPWIADARPADHRRIS
jgi:(R,R)-butanediol dehydrogenase/meso-butanediol dehydrogenase/diacetyl reductase